MISKQNYAQREHTWHTKKNIRKNAVHHHSREIMLLCCVPSLNQWKADLISLLYRKKTSALYTTVIINIYINVSAFSSYKNILCFIWTTKQIQYNQVSDMSTVMYCKKVEKREIRRKEIRKEVIKTSLYNRNGMYCVWLKLAKSIAPNKSMKTLVFYRFFIVFDKITFSLFFLIKV